MEKDSPTGTKDGDHGERAASEIPWKRRFVSLRDQGYLLGPRYRPGRSPSREKRESVSRTDSENAMVPPVSQTNAFVYSLSSFKAMAARTAR